MPWAAQEPMPPGIFRPWVPLEVQATSYLAASVRIWSFWSLSTKQTSFTKESSNKCLCIMVIITYEHLFGNQRDAGGEPPRPYSPRLYALLGPGAPASPVGAALQSWQTAAEEPVVC